jgi:hypothetical protein
VKDERVYLEHIRDALVDIEQHTSVGRDAFLTDRMRQDAVIRKLEQMRRFARRHALDVLERQKGGMLSDEEAMVLGLEAQRWARRQMRKSRAKAK